MMCTNVSMWGPVYWTAENVTRCTCEIETIEEEKMEMVCTYHIKQADYLLLYEQNWLKEGTEALVLKKTAESSR